MAFAGCSFPAFSPFSRVTPFFVPDAQDIELYQTLGQKADQLLVRCSARHSCDRAHFLRGLVALYENRDIATSHFQAAVAAAPSGDAAASSLFWLQLMEKSHPYSGQAPLAQATTQLLSALLDQELVMRQVMNGTYGTDLAALKRELQAREKRLAELTKELETTSIPALYRELKARDRKLEDVTKQLEALKQIDREMRGRMLPARPGLPPSLKKENP
jgi:hypothetical protein